MPIEILMPALSPTMEEGTLSKWLVKEGDQVSSGDLLAEIETDKATMEIEAVEEGTIVKLLVPEGNSNVKVNKPIAILLEEGEDLILITVEIGDGGNCYVGYRSCFYRSIPMGPIDNGREIEMEFLEKEKKFDPEEVYKGQPNPTKI